MKNIIESLKSGNYKVEDLVFFKMGIYHKMFHIENKVTREDKIQIMDKYTDGLITYMLKLINLWNEEKEGLPKNQFKVVKTVSRNAWLKRNDTRKIIHTDYVQSIYYRIIGCDRYECVELSLICENDNYGLERYTGNDIVRQWFHDFCFKKQKEERVWHKENDPMQIKITRVMKLGSSHREVFNNKLLNDIVYNNKVDATITDFELDIFIKAYENLDECIKKQASIIAKILGAEAKCEEE